MCVWPARPLRRCGRQQQQRRAACRRHRLRAGCCESLQVPEKQLDENKVKQVRMLLCPSSSSSGAAHYQHNAEVRARLAGHGRAGGSTEG